LEQGNKKILIVQTGFIGDVVLSTPLVEALIKIYPGAELSILTTPASSEIFKEDLRIKEVIKFDKRAAHSGIGGFYKILKEIKKRQFDIVFSLHKSSRTSLLLAFSGIPLTYGFSQASLSFLYTKVAKRNKTEHDVYRNLSILSVLDLDYHDFSFPLSISLSELTINKVKNKLKIFEEKKIVAIAPGSVWLTKTWTKEGFSELCEKLILSDYRIVLIGGPSDLDLSKEIVKTFDSENKYEDKYLNLVGRLSILESVALIKNSYVVVANDSAPLHFASSMQTPVVAIFCATIPEFGFGPWMTPNKILEVKNLSCRPCGRHGGNSCPTGTHACRLGISATQVLKAVSELVP